MKKLFGFLLVASLFTAPAAIAQTQAAPEDAAVTLTETENSGKESKADKKKQQRENAEMRSNGNAYSGRGAKAAQPVSPFASNTSTSGFTVTRYKETKVQKKIRRGEGATRMSVPDPKGKPLKHKKKNKFLFFN